jgi:hypothetical protein
MSTSDLQITGNNVFSPVIVVPGDGLVNSQASISGYVQSLANRTTWLKNNASALSSKLSLAYTMRTQYPGSTFTKTNRSDGYGFRFVLPFDAYVPDMASNTISYDMQLSVDIGCSSVIPDFGALVGLSWSSDGGSTINTDHSGDTEWSDITSSVPITPNWAPASRTKRIIKRLTGFGLGPASGSSRVIVVDIVFGLRPSPYYVLTNIVWSPALLSNVGNPTASPTLFVMAGV